MEATIVLVLFLTFLFGGMLLALVMGYHGIEDSRVEQTPDHARARAAAVAEAIAGGFLPQAADRIRPIPTITFDDALLTRLERYVKAEQDIVSQFVHLPSVESLYSSSKASLRAN